MKVYQITEKGLTSFEAWLEMFLHSKIGPNKDILQPAFDKIEIVKVLKDTYMTETQNSNLQSSKIDSITNDELKDEGPDPHECQDTQDNIIKALNSVYSVLYGIVYPDQLNDKCASLDDLQDILIKITQRMDK